MATNAICIECAKPCGTDFNICNTCERCKCKSCSVPFDLQRNARCLLCNSRLAQLNSTTNCPSKDSLITNLNKDTDENELSYFDFFNPIRPRRVSNRSPLAVIVKLHLEILKLEDWNFMTFPKILSFCFLRKNHWHWSFSFSVINGLSGYTSSFSWIFRLTRRIFIIRFKLRFHALQLLTERQATLCDGLAVHYEILCSLIASLSK